MEHQKKTNIKVRQASAGDLARISEIERSCFESPWTEKMIADSFADEMNAVWVAEIKDDSGNIDIAGFLIAFCTTGINAEIYDIAVDPKYRRCGAAHNLINFMLCYCNLIAVEKILLDVNVNNSAAISLYKSFDFKEDGIRPKYYDNKDDAILMSRVVTIEVNMNLL